MARLLRAVLLAVTVAATAGGLGACGSEGPTEPASGPHQRLTATERAAAASGRAAIRFYCRRLGRYLTGNAGPPGARTRTHALAGARALARLSRQKPQAPYAPDQTVRQLAGDTAEDLEGTNCSAGLVAELERGL